MNFILKCLAVVLLLSFIDTTYNSGIGLKAVRQVEALAIVETSIRDQGWE
jgi:hypothetical protein